MIENANDIAEPEIVVNCGSCGDELEHSTDAGFKRRLTVAGDSDYRIDLGNAARSLSSAQHRASEFSATHTTSQTIAVLAEQTKENTQ